jgi:uncharacterized membrane protein
MLTTPRRFELLVALLTVAFVALAAASSVGAVDIVAGIPLAVLLPGAALVAAVDPWHKQVPGPERAMWFFGASVGIVIMGGLLLNLIGGLTRPHWLILLAVVVGASLLVAWVRSGAQGAPAGQDETIAEAETGRGLGVLTIRPIALLLVAVVAVVGGLVLSQRTNAESTREHFVQAWILSQPTGNVYSTTATLGVRNEEGKNQTIVLHVRIGSSESTLTVVGLKDGQAWTHRVSRGPGQAVSVSVALATSPSSILDRVSLAKPS